VDTQHACPKPPQAAVVLAHDPVVAVVVLQMGLVVAVL